MRPENGIKSTPICLSCLKISHKGRPFKKSQIVVKYLGNFLWQFVTQELSKIAQYGHTDLSIKYLISNNANIKKGVRRDSKPRPWSLIFAKQGFPKCQATLAGFEPLTVWMCNHPTAFTILNYDCPIECTFWQGLNLGSSNTKTKRRLLCY